MGMANGGSSKGDARGTVAVERQGFRVELAATAEQRTRLGQHAGLFRVVENFCLELVTAALAQRAAEKTYGIGEKDLTPVPYSAPTLERAWRAAHPSRYPWFAQAGLSSRIPKEACRVRAAGLRNWVASRTGKRAGRRLGFPTWRTRKHGSRFRYDADTARPDDTRTVHLPKIGKVHTLEDMSWLTGRIGDGRAGSSAPPCGNRPAGGGYPSSSRSTAPTSTPTGPSTHGRRPAASTWG